MDFDGRQLEVIQAALRFLSVNFEDEDWEHMPVPIEFDEVTALAQVLESKVS